MGGPPMDNGDAFMRAQRAAMQQAAQQATMQQRYMSQMQQQRLGPMQQNYLGQMQQNYRSEPMTPGEKPEPEDTTGLKLLEEFLTKRRSVRDDDERK